MELLKLISKYYETRQLKYPNIWEALAFTQTELGEVYEILLAQKGGWIRNNPQNKPDFSKEELAKELGDSIMMLVVAGMAEGVDPIQALTDKINSKLSKINQPPLPLSEPE